MAAIDGLGERRSDRDRDGNDVEHLCIGRDLAGVPSFEFALRERVSRLASFRHPSYARVRSIERSGVSDAPLTVVSDHTPGHRLSTLLSEAASREVTLDTGAALCLIRQLVPAIAILQESARDASHGAIGPERLIVTPQLRLVVTEYVLGSALEQLLFPRDRYWVQLRVPLPRVAGLARFDHLADVAQIGMVALALLHGRLLKHDEFPARTADLVSGAAYRTADGEEEPLAPALTCWLERSLQLDPRQSFTTASEARTALDRAVDESGYDAAPKYLAAFLGRVTDVAGQAASPAVPPAAAPPAALLAAPVPEVRTAPLQIVASTEKGSAPHAASLAADPPEATTPAAPAVTVVLAAATAVPPAAVATLPASTNPPPAPPAGAPPTVSTTPATVSPTPVTTPLASPVTRPATAAPPRVNQTPTPARSTSSFLSPPESSETGVPMELLAAAPARSRAVIGAALAVTLLVGSAGTFAARQFFGTTHALAAATGALSVTTNPPGASLLVDGTDRGTTPATLDLAPGAHRLVVRGSFGLREVPVTIVAGSRVAQFLDLPQPPPAPAPAPEVQEPPVSAAPLAAAAPAVSDGPVGGWIAVAGRFDLQVFEGGKLLGSSQSDRIMVAAGAHEFELVNSELGYRSVRKVEVAAGKTASLTVDVPKGTLAVNALPWAEVSIDGEAAGETPLGNVSLPIGHHDVVFRHPELGEQRHRIAVTLNGPARLSVDLRRK